MKKTFLYTFLISFAALMLSAFFWAAIPSTMPVHWDATGQANGFAPRAIGLMLLPAVSLLSSGLLLAVAAKSKERRNDRTMQRIALGSSLFLFAVHGLMIHAALQTSQSFSMATFLVLLGLFIAALGKTMPMLYPNAIAGVRTPWNRKNEVNWSLTHRAAKWCMLTTGLVCAVAGVALSPPLSFWIGLSSITIGSLAPVAVSYTVHCVQES